ncbi:MAG: hypothetical protein AAFQ87_20160, partial [Bacteroidota bacterium]
QIQHGKLAPYIGLSFNSNFYRQRVRSEEEVGPGLIRNMVPLHAGLVYNHKSFLFEAGLSYFGRGEEEYFLSRDQLGQFARPRLGATVGMKWFLDTTIGAERGWENGKDEAKADRMTEEGLLNNFSLAIGPSAAFSTARSPFNASERPWLDDHRGTSVFLELGLGYYLAKPDLHFNLSWRQNSSTIRSYGVEQRLGRQAYTLEAYKFLFDYHGFVPYIGPNISFERLSALETDRGTTSLDLQQNKIVPGLTFGWDIRPNRLQWFILRTNLRYSPFLTLDTPSGERLNFSQLEFNFITFVWYPGRGKKIARYQM